MIYIIIFLFLASALLAIIRLNLFYKKIIFIIFGILLILLAAFRGEGVDRDYLNYVAAYLEKDPAIIFSDPTFAFISFVGRNYLGGNIVFLFFSYAFISISLKFYSIQQLSNNWFLSIVVYLSYIYTLQDLTQIRIGAAVAFMLLSIKPAYERNIWKFLLCVFLATLFHVSAFVVSSVWFLNSKKINKFIYLSAIPVSYILYFVLGRYFTDLIQLIDIVAISGKIKAYATDNESFVNVFNAWQILRCSLCLLFIWKIDLISMKNQYAILLVKLYVISTCIFVLLANNPSFAGRLSDVFAVSDIILLPCLVEIIKEKKAGFLLVIVISSFYLILNLFYNKILS